MSRTKDLLGMAAACILVIGAGLAGCAPNDPTSAANAPAAVAGPTVASDDLPEVVVSAPRAGTKPIVLSERNSSSAKN